MVGSSMEEWTGYQRGETLVDGEKGWLSSGFARGTRRRVEEDEREMKKKQILKFHKKSIFCMKESKI